MPRTMGQSQERFLDRPPAIPMEAPLQGYERSRGYGKQAPHAGRDLPPTASKQEGKSYSGSNHQSKATREKDDDPSGSAGNGDNGARGNGRDTDFEKRLIGHDLNIFRAF